MLKHLILQSMIGLSIVMAQQLIVDEDTSKLLTEILDENGIHESVLETDHFNASQYRVELVLEIDEFRNRYDRNLPDMFRKKYIQVINQKLKNDTRKFFIEKAYNNFSSKSNSLINLDYELTEKDIKMLEQEMISKYWVLNEQYINDEVKIFKNMTQYTNYEVSNKVITDRFVELHAKTLIERFENDKPYRKTYITEAREEFLDEAFNQYEILTEVMIEESEKSIEKAYMTWLENYDRIKLLQMLNDIHQLAQDMDIELELPADMPDYTKMPETYTATDKEPEVHRQLRVENNKAYWKNKFKDEYHNAKQAMIFHANNRSIWDDGSESEDYHQDYMKMFPEYWEQLDEKQRMIEF